MKRLIITLLILLSYTEFNIPCTTDANCSLIYYGEVRGGYVILEDK